MTYNFIDTSMLFCNVLQTCWMIIRLLFSQVLRASCPIIVVHLRTVFEVYVYVIGAQYTSIVFWGAFFDT